MKHNKKAYIFLAVILISVIAIGSITATYAWFLSRYSKDYEFLLDSESPVVLKYRTDLTFASGNISTSTNVLKPAVAKRYTAAINQTSLSAMDVFDTTKVDVAAQAVKFSAKGAYWTGDGTIPGRFTFSLAAYLDSVAESSQIANGANDLVAEEGNRTQEISSFVIFDYLDTKILYHHDVEADTFAYYVNVATEVASDYTLPATAESDNNLRYWKRLQAFDTIGGAEIYDGTYLLLQPNTFFSFTLYAFVAKTDEERDPVIDGATITLSAKLKVEDEEGGNE